MSSKLPNYFIAKCSWANICSSLRYITVFNLNDSKYVSATKLILPIKEHDLLLFFKKYEV